VYIPTDKTVTDDEPKRAAVGAFLATEEVNVLRVGIIYDNIVLEKLEYEKLQIQLVGKTYRLNLKIINAKGS